MNKSLPKRVNMEQAWIIGIFLCVSLSIDAAIVEKRGEDFTGGTTRRIGLASEGVPGGRYLLAQPVEASKISVDFELAEKPSLPHVLRITAKSSDPSGKIKLEIALNGQSIAGGESRFTDRLSTRQFELPHEALTQGRNELTITRTQGAGWILLATAMLCPPAAVTPERFHVTIPGEAKTFPTEPSDGAAPRFKFRGTKGWGWTARQYLEEIPHLQRIKMNFLMNCYLSMVDDATQRNRWWEPLPEQKKMDYERIVAECGKAGITFCFAMHPQFSSDRPLKFGSDEDFEAFFQHFAWMQSLGVKWFSISMDDVGGGDQGTIHAQFCNKFLERLRKTDPEAQLIFCPAPYATVMIKEQESYLPELAKDLHPDVYVFWTGPEVVSFTISRQDAEYFRDLCGHRLIIWDNYPVNDSRPTLHLGPITGRDPELPLVVDGYISNPHHTQNLINRIPLYTMADYAYNPRDYDPLRSIGQAVALLAETPDARRVLADLVEAYPGTILYRNGQPGFCSPVEEFHRLLTSPSGRALAEAQATRMRQLYRRYNRDLRQAYPDIEPRLREDVQIIQKEMENAYPMTE